MAGLLAKLRSGNGLRLALEVFAASGISFLATALPSVGLPAAEYMLGFYWMQGANIAFFAFEVAALRDVALRQWSDAIIRLRWLFRLGGMAGIFFMPRPWEMADLVRGALLGGFLAEALFRYLLALTSLRSAGKFVESQRFVRQSALFRLGLTASLVALVRWHWLPSWADPSTLFVLAVAGSYLPWSSFRPLPAPARTASTKTAAALWLGLRAMAMTLAARSIVPAMTYAVSERYRPALTVIAAGALVAGSLGIQLLLDAGLSERRRVLVIRGLVAAIGCCAVVVGVEAWLTPDGWLAAALAGAVAGTASSALVAAVIFGGTKSVEQAALDKAVALGSVAALMTVPDPKRVLAVAIAIPLLGWVELRHRWVVRWAESTR